jgi:hypothetical protein
VTPTLRFFFRIPISGFDEKVFDTALFRTTIVPLAAAALVAAYATYERIRGVKRNWLHVLGIVTWALYWVVDWAIRK